jgi:hypothetical protein
MKTRFATMPNAKGGERMRTFKWMAVLVGALMLVPAFAEVKSGPGIGGGAPPYNPNHIGGPFKGKTTCPV